MAKSSAAAATRKILATKTAHLPVPLTTAELVAVAEQMGRVEGDMREFYARKKEVTSDLKAKEEALDAELGKLGRLQRDKQEYRPVPVRVEADFKVGKVYEIREDSGEVIGERAVNEQDRQTSIFKAEPKNEPLPLDWHTEGDNQVAEVNGGTYCIEPGQDGSHNVLWTPAGGRTKRIGYEPTAADAKALARKHQLEAVGDAILDNAGDGALTKADTKGDAVARKRGRRG